MVKHLVLWRLKATEEPERLQIFRNMKNALEGLNGQIPGLLRLEVGWDFSRGEHSADVALYSEFTDRAALADYIVHPAHQAAANGAVRPFVSERRVADYEV